MNGIDMNECSARAEKVLSGMNAGQYASASSVGMGCDSGSIRRLDFGEALNWLKRGQSVTRLGWNGKGQSVSLVQGSDSIKPCERASTLSGISSSLFDFGDKGTVRRMPHLRIQTVDEATATWVPSITDLLAEDWVVR